MSSYKQGGGSDYPWTTDTSGAENDMIETSLNRSLVVSHETPDKGSSQKRQ